MHKRVGDTLVEVTLAIGIFSMVAIAVVAVVSGSTSGAQSALETTVTREQIDAQAEALRFIHNSYIADVKTDQDAAGNATTTEPYTSLWRAATRRANIEDEFSEEELRAHLTPDTCASVYNGNTLRDHGAFIINTRALGNVKNRSVDEIILTPAEDSGANKFIPAVTFPRLVYGGKIGQNEVTSYLDDINNVNQTLTSAEGLYIIPVKDADSTTIVTSETVEHGAAYYDFYIMSCWYAGNAERPSTISTVIRLYDPDAITESAQDHSVKISFNGNGATSGRIGMEKVPFGSTFVLPGVENFYRQGYKFVGWSTKRDTTVDEVKSGLKNDDVQTYLAGETYQAPNWLDDKYSDYKTFYAIWEPIPYTLHIAYDTQGGNNIGESVYNNVKYLDTININTIPTRSSYFFIGWTTDPDWNLTTWDRNNTTQVLTAANNPTDTDGADVYLTLNANWEPNYHIFYSTDSVQQVNSHYCHQSAGDCYVSSEKPTKSGYLFNGWCTVGLSAGETCSGRTFYSSNTIDYDTLKSRADGNNNVTLYAIWSIFNDTITARATWNEGRVDSATMYPDFDTYVYGQKSNGTTFLAYYYSKISSDLDGTTIAQLDHDCISSCGDETFVINTLGGRNYYYYVYNRTGSFATNGLTIVVSSPQLGTYTFESKNASGTLTGTYNYWNVFAYIDGKFVIKNTITSSPNTSYRE